MPGKIEIRLNIPPDTGTILADPTQVHQVVINLCTNAAHALEEAGSLLEVSLEEVEFNDEDLSKYLKINQGKYIQLTVRDNGCGMDANIKDRMFDPYFSTKETSKGAGIGLSVVQGIVERFNGTILVSSEPGKGTTIKVLFPVIDAEPGIIEEAVPEVMPAGDERVLFVDDEEAIVKSGKKILKGLGYKVDTYTKPVEALEVFRSNPDQFDLVVTDMTMPHMGGDVLIKEILKIRSDMPIILCTGFSEKISNGFLSELGIRKYFEKPVGKYELSIAVRRLLDEKK